MTSNQPVPATQAPGPAGPGRRALVIAVVALVVLVIVSALLDLSWLNWLLQRPWLALLLGSILAVVVLALLDWTRPKNRAWRQLRADYGEPFDAAPDRSQFGTGRGRLGSYGYFGLRSFGAAKGLEVGRIVAFANPPLYIPWTAVAKIDAYPNLLTGRQGFESDMQARIVLRQQPDLSIEVPWLKEYRQLLPNSVRYRSIKLSKK